MSRSQLELTRTYTSLDLDNCASCLQLRMLHTGLKPARCGINQLFRKQVPFPREACSCHKYILYLYFFRGTRIEFRTEVARGRKSAHDSREGPDQAGRYTIGLKSRGTYSTQINPNPLHVNRFGSSQAHVAHSCGNRCVPRTRVVSGMLRCDALPMRRTRMRVRGHVRDGWPEPNVS